MDLRLYFYTLRHLKLRQILHQIQHKIRLYPIRDKRFIKGAPIHKTGFILELIPYIEKTDSYLGEKNFTFLNLNADFIGWEDKRQGALWLYNLNYMDFILQKKITFEDVSYWINLFIDTLPLNQSGMEPYPISLRGINWIKCISYYRELIPVKEKQKWDSSLYSQYRCLYSNLEFHLLGNHLLENAYSLLWGGLYFREDKFYEKAVWLLTQELNEQILPDGAHYELSPMYHEILLDRLLDCINALKYNYRFEGQESVIAFLEEKSRLMLSWLNAIIYKDGTIPLLNDSAYGIAPSARDLFAYAKRLAIQWSTHKLKESGYRKFVSDTFEMIMDVGNIGPDYIPGHAHADTFNYELRIDGKPFIIDSGISTYEKNSRRQYERETHAHNTVQVDGKSSSKVWGGFRVAQRAKISGLKEDKFCITASHNGFRETGISHQRIFNMNDEEIMICDSLLPLSEKKGITMIHLHPDIRIISVNNDSIKTNLAIFWFYGTDEIWIEDCEVAFEYNKRVATKKICIAFTNQMQYTINKFRTEHK